MTHRAALSTFVLASTLLPAAAALADGIAEEARLRFHNLRADASPAVLTNAYTGSIQLTVDANTELFSLITAGDSHTVAGSVTFFDATFKFDGGAMTSGYAHAIVTNPAGAPTILYSEYNPKSASGFIFQDIGSLYENNFFTDDAGFSRDVIAGTDIAPWATGLPLSGPVFISQLSPDASLGIDPDVNCEFHLLENKPLSAADLNNDGIVDSSDLASLLAAWSPMP